MRRIKYLLLVIGIMTCLAACSKDKESGDNKEIPDYSIFEQKYSSFSNVYIYHGKTKIELDYEDKDKQLLNSITRYIMSNADYIKETKELFVAKSDELLDYSDYDDSEYYIQLNLFTGRDLKINSGTNVINCDSILIELNSLKLHTSIEKAYSGGLSYESDDADTKKEQKIEADKLVKELEKRITSNY